MLKLSNINFEYDHRPILSNVVFTINEREKIGLVGPNGVGKTTLLKIIAGLLEPTRGSVIKEGNIHIGYLPQEISEWGEQGSLEYLKRFTGVAEAEDNLQKATSTVDETDNSMSRLQEALDDAERLGIYTFAGRLKKALSRVNLDENSLDLKIKNLSGGQKTRLSLAAILLSQKDILLLDEPTNNLDIEGLELLETFLSGNNKSAYVIVSHDRRFLRKVATKIISLAPDGKGVEIYSLGYDEFIEARKKKTIAMEQAYSQFLEKRKDLKEAAELKERQAHRAASNKSRSDTEKLGRNAAQEKAAKSHASTAKSMLSRLEQLKAPPPPPEEINLSFTFDKCEDFLGETAIKLINAKVVFSSNQSIGPFNLSISGRDRIVITGPNGAGKTTMLKIILGTINASGNITKNPKVRIGYIDQDQTMPLPNKSLLDNVKKVISSNGKIKEESEIRTLLANFNFDSSKVMQKAMEVSPGERYRCLLASLVAKGTNILLLDEPTNHLDIDAAEELEAAIRSYRAAYIIISHDRDFIDSIKPNRLIEIKNGKITKDDYLGIGNE